MNEPVFCSVARSDCQVLSRRRNHSMPADLLRRVVYIDQRPFDDSLLAFHHESIQVGLAGGRWTDGHPDFK